MVDLNAHEAGNGGQSQGKPTTRGVLLYSERKAPPLTVVLAREFRSVEGLHPPEIFNSNEKKNTAICRYPQTYVFWRLAGILPSTDHNRVTSQQSRLDVQMPVGVKSAVQPDHPSQR